MLFATILLVQAGSTRILYTHASKPSTPTIFQPDPVVALHQKASADVCAMGNVIAAFGEEGIKLFPFAVAVPWIPMDPRAPRWRSVSGGWVAPWGGPRWVTRECYLGITPGAVEPPAVDKYPGR